MNKSNKTIERPTNEMPKTNAQATAEPIGETGAGFPTIRMRRLRYHPLVRNLVRETRLTRPLRPPVSPKRGARRRKRLSQFDFCVAKRKWVGFHPFQGFRRTGFNFRMNDESHDVVLRSLEAIQSRDKIETVKEIAPPIAATEPKGVRSAGQTVEFGSGSMRLFTLNRRLNFGFG